MKSFFYKRLSFLFFLFTLIHSSFFFSQEMVISGLENIHVSEGATVIINNNSETKIISEKPITSSENKKIVSEKKAQKKAEPKVVIAKKAKKIISDKTINEVISLKASKIICSSNRKTDEAFSIFTSNFSKGNTPSKDDVSKFLHLKNEIIFISYNFEIQQNLLYYFYHSKKVEDFLFARPPPSVLV